ncbi:MAG: tetratricopeptide repeat protein [Verrucomicrobiia bacterium]
MKNGWRLLAAVCTLVIGFYAYMSLPGDWEKFGLQSPAESPYNLLVQGFRAGQLSLKKDVPVGFAQLADPYDPVANEVYRFSPYKLQDLSYYKGRLYPYYGVTPALILFWPYNALTGAYLSNRQAVTIFCAIGFLASVGLLRTVWRRYFAGVNIGVVAACAVALGLATSVLEQLSQAGIYQVPHACGYMLTMLVLAAIWKALHDPGRRGRWLAAASVAYGLAVGSRPNLLFGAVILLAPVAQAWRERKRVWHVLAAATIPITLIGCGLMLYNELRFDTPWEFGERYILNAEHHMTIHIFSLRYLRLNFWLYFLEPGRWSARFPFLHAAPVPPSPAGNFLSKERFGVLANIPLTWLALAVPLAWRGRLGQTGSILRRFVAATALLFGTSAFTLGLFCVSNFNYEMDFLPALMLLAVIGILGVERALAERPVWRRAARCGWGMLLGFSVAFNLLATAGHYAEADTIRGVALGVAGRHQEAIKQYERAQRIEPEYAPSYNCLGDELLRAGKVSEAITNYEQALRLYPNNASAHYNLANLLAQNDRDDEALSHYTAATRLTPSDPRIWTNLGNLFLKQGRRDEAIAAYAKALRIDPTAFEAHNNIAIALANSGDLVQATEHFREASRLSPSRPEIHSALAEVLERQGLHDEAQRESAEAHRLSLTASPN